MADRNDDAPASAGGSATRTSRGGWPLRRRLLERDSYGVLFALIVLLLITTAIGGGSTAGRAIAAVLQGAVLLYALWTARAGRHVFRAAVVVVPTVVVVVAAASGRSSNAAVAAVAATEAALSLAAIAAIGRQLIAHPRVSAATILGALCMYLLIGMFFASVYATVNAMSGDSFFVTETAPRSIDFLYFSYVTLTTVGYGDLTAAGDLGRMLAVTEALLGQLYLVTVVALVIGNIGRERTRA
ncbi:MAG TPA: potassium channel family protein [Actinomycetota bacterium]